MRRAACRLGIARQAGGSCACRALLLSPVFLSLTTLAVPASLLHTPAAVDQRAERVGRTRVRVGIYSLAVDEQRPWLMLTGGADPLLRLYDRRMLPGGGEDGGAGGGRRATQWASAYVPSHLKAAIWDAGRHPALAAPSAPGPPGRHVTAVAFARGGAELVGSYAGEAIYSFGVAAHARDVEALLHIPESVLRWVLERVLGWVRSSAAGAPGPSPHGGSWALFPLLLCCCAACLLVLLRRCCRSAQRQ